VREGKALVRILIVSHYRFSRPCGTRTNFHPPPTCSALILFRPGLIQAHTSSGPCGVPSKTGIRAGLLNIASPFPTARTGFFRNRIRQLITKPAEGQASKRILTCPFRKNSHNFGRWAGVAAGVLSIGTTAIEFRIRGERYLFEESPAVSKKLSLPEANRVSLLSLPRRWEGRLVRERAGLSFGS